jgi:hypothetical protein
MTLLLPAPPAFGYFITNDDSPASATAFGTAVTAAGTANTKGTWVAIHATISYDLYVHNLMVTAGGTAAASDRFLFDLGIGPDAANVTVIAENLVGDNVASVISGGRYYGQVPLYVPAGTQLWARCQSETASDAMRLWVASWGAPDHPESFPKVSYIEALGAGTSGVTTGATVSVGASGALGTATSMGSFTRDVCAVFMAGGSDDTSLTAVAYVGALATDSTPTVQELGVCFTMNGSANNEVRGSSSVIWCDIPSGQIVSGRLSCTGTSDSTMWAIAYGCVRG